MRQSIKHPTAFFTAAPLFALLCLPPVFAQSAPAGWQARPAGGGATIYTPPHLAPGQIYLVAVFAPAALHGRTLADWLRATAGADAPPSGAAQGPLTVRVVNDRVAVASRTMTVGSKSVSSLYTASLAAGGGGTARLTRVVWTGDLYQAYKAETLALVSAAARSGGPPAARPPSHQPVSKTSVLPAARPGAGVKTAQIAGIYCQPSYGGGAGGFMSVSYEPVLALKDGTYCGGFEVPPSDLDVAASRRAHPRQWGRWRGAAKSTQTLSSKGVWEKSGWIGPLPVPPTRLSGKYTRVSGGGTVAAGGQAMVAFQSTYVFSPDGHFRSGDSMGATAPGVAAGSDRKASGTYTISGYAITMRFADGTQQRWSCARTQDGLLFLHGDAYTDDK